MNGSFTLGLTRHINNIGANEALADARCGVSISYKALSLLMSKVGGLTRRSGLQPGDAIAAFLPNSIEGLVLFLGAVAHEIDYAPLSQEATDREVNSWLDLVKPKLCVVATGNVGHCSDAIRKTGIPIIEIEVDGLFSWLAAEESVMWSHHSGRLHIKTSGTTGEPKALVFSVDRLWASGGAFMALHPSVGLHPRFLNLLPMAYLGGLYNLGLIPLFLGGTVVISEPFSGRTFLTFWHTVERFDINVLWLVPSIVRGLMLLAQRSKPEDNRARGRHVRLCFLGTAPISNNEKIAFEETFGIPTLENFALSETTFLTTETLPRTMLADGRHSGTPLPYVEIRVQPLTDENVPTGDPNLGELLVKTPFFWLGYLNKDGSITRPLTEDGFLRTGDIGRILNDGGVKIEGRLRDFVKRGGYFVPLREIEVIAGEHPDVLEAVAVGVPHPFYGEAIFVAVQLKTGSDEACSIATKIENWLRDNLARHNWVEKVIIVDEFPRTSSGKIQKHVLKTQFSSSR
jgi:acyl-CoA synthetase (AMP-forming)/AMP-acid ligase II